MAGIITSIEDAIWGWADLVLNPAAYSYTVIISSCIYGGLAYSITINGTTYTTTADVTDTVTTILCELKSLIDAASLPLITSVSNNQLLIQATAGSAAFTCRVSPNMNFASPLVPIIWMHQNETIPNTTYITLHNMTSDRRGLPYKSAVQTQFNPDGSVVAGSDIQTIIRTEKFTISIQSYGLNGDEYLEQLRESLDYSYIAAYMDSVGISSLNDTAVKDISAILDMTAEPRSVFEVTFLTNIETTEEVGFIQTVGYSGSYSLPN
jgi:hypothetical protein